MAKKDKGIELSPKHGVNPSLEVCFWCGNHMGVALLGRIKNGKTGDSDVEAPREICMGLEPCDECKKKFAQGVQLIEVTEDADGKSDAFAMRDTDGVKHYPTGRYAVLKPKAVKGGRKGGIALCSKETMDTILGPADQEKEGSKTR